MEAEVSVLGSILLEPAVLPRVRERIAIHQPFYDLRHARIFGACCAVVDEAKGNAAALDLVTLTNRLKSTGNFEEVGGLAYLATIPDKVPSAGNLDYYLDIVWAKYVARVAMRTLTRSATQIFTAGATPAVLDEVAGQIDELKRAAAAPSSDVRPPRVKLCSDFGEKYFNAFFGAEAEEPGTPLPFKHENFPFKIRGGEMTFLIGEKGAGKTTLETWVALNLGRYDWKSFVASFEMKPEITLKIAASQLIGMNKLEDCEQHKVLARDALTWLNLRFVLYDFLGIGDWRSLLEDMRYAVEFLNCRFFLVDSVMRLGIPDDDYRQQGECAAAFANFCITNDVHMFLTNHLNKSEGGPKSRSRGSQQWIDNSHNVVSVTRNEKKAERIAELRQQDEQDRIAGEYSHEASEKKWKELNTLWDSKFSLHNQRWPGSRQNGSLYLWFDRYSQQLRDDPKAPVGVNYLRRWTKQATPEDL